MRSQSTQLLIIGCFILSLLIMVKFLCLNSLDEQIIFMQGI